ncbi:MAG: hypothetical protein OJF49_001911 [Ktedonobacterales bacterium]|jgi:hypothetical protein|nr:MAG: hypothetical protein OJF49_001911 [Ktedonobacterales bacterium]
MIRSSLTSLDEPYWHLEPDYSEEVARRLRQALALLAQAHTRPDAYLKIHEVAFSCLGLSMSVRQRMCVFYFLGVAFLGGESPKVGIACLDEAAEHARTIGDWVSKAQLEHLKGAAYREATRYSGAITALQTGLEVLREAYSGDQAEVAELEIDLLTGVADCAYLLDDRSTAREYIFEARSLLLHLPELGTYVATIDWFDALILRWDGKPEEALRRAMAACDAYAQAMLPTQRISYGRLQTVITDIALDLAEGFSAQPPHHARDSYITLAHPYITRALEVADRMSDEIGEMLALLAQARFDRAAGRDMETTKTIATVVERAEKIGDIPLLAQAHTALGHDLLASGWTDAGLNSYRRTLDILRGTDVPAMGKWARDGLIAASKRYG